MFINITPPQKLSNALIDLVKKNDKKYQDNVSVVVLQQEKEDTWDALWK